MKATRRQLQDISRLPSQAVFDSLRKTRELRWVAPSLILQALPRDGETPFGMCISASRKTAPHAVDRNRMRRRLKAVASDILPRCAKPGMDYMISCRIGAKDLPAETLEKDLRWCLKKLNLLAESPVNDGC